MSRPRDEAAVLDPGRRRVDTEGERELSADFALRARSLAPVVVIGIVAAVVRFSLIDHQSLWFDEIVSATLAKQPFGSNLHEIASTESTPPLYYVFL
jgi:hypothetical protein